MARLKLERAGKRMRSKKFRVLIDGDEVGTLQKWGDSDEFKVAPGSHTVNIKSFGAKTGSLGVDFTDDGIVDLLCGFGEGPVEGNFAPILIWTRVEELDPQAVQELFDRGEGFVEAALPMLVEVSDHFELSAPKEDRMTFGHRIKGSLDGYGLALSSGFWPGPGTGEPGPFFVRDAALANETGISEQEFHAQLDRQQPHPYWKYDVLYDGSPKSLGFKNRKHLPRGGFVLPDGSFLDTEDMEYRKNGGMVRQVRSIYGDADDATDTSSLDIGPISASFTTKEESLTATDLITKGQILLDLVTQGVALLKR